MFFVREWLFILNELGYNKRERLRPLQGGSFYENVFNDERLRRFSNRHFSGGYEENPHKR